MALKDDGRQVTLTPPASGHSALHQRAYRRGSTLNDDWYFVGENDGDGHPITDTLSDTEIQLAATLPTEHLRVAPATTKKSLMLKS